MTVSYDKIIAEYRDADFNQRLHMYLQFPRLSTSIRKFDNVFTHSVLSAE
jgi:hypothetical protein